MSALRQLQTIVIAMLLVSIPLVPINVRATVVLLEMEQFVQVSNTSI